MHAIKRRECRKIKSFDFQMLFASIVGLQIFQYILVYYQQQSHGASMFVEVIESTPESLVINCIPCKGCTEINNLLI